MDFLDREMETAILQRELASAESKFLVLYGRRRIGKSALLQNISDSSCVYYLADINEASIQRSFFAVQLEPFVQGFSALVYPDWNTLFTQLNMRLQHRITVIIDEFPYLVRSSPELPSVLQKMIDLHHNSMFHLVICGSSQQMMHGLVMHKTAPLFGRAHRILKLQPMRPRWLQAALNLDSKQTISEYAVWGGVPRYWDLRRGYENLQEAITELILNQYGVLHEEPLRLFLEDMNSAVQPISIASLIGQGCCKLSEIAARLNKPATSLNRPLQMMMEAGYVKRELCWGENGKNSKKTQYRLADALSNFFFTFVVPHQSKLHSANIGYVQDLINSRWSMFVSQTWEELGRERIGQSDIEGISFLPGQRWWQQSQKNGSAEIDIIAESVDGKVLLVGEAKWQKNVNPSAILKELERKLGYLPTIEKYDKIIKLVLAPELKEKTEGDVLLRNADFICKE